MMFSLCCNWIATICLILLGKFSLVKIIDIVSRLKPNSDPDYVLQSERKHAATVFIIYYCYSRVFKRIVIDANFPRPSGRLFNAIIIIILIFFYQVL